jgi:hypothetical protein
MTERCIVAGALGNCVHVAGVYAFLRAAEAHGYRTIFLGAAVPVARFVEAIRTHDPEWVGVSYRLTPTVAAHLVADLHETLAREGLLTGRRFLFGGTPPVCAAVQSSGLFTRAFDGLEPPGDLFGILAGRDVSAEAPVADSSLLARLARKAPYPLLRHHFGLPDLGSTTDGIRAIAASGLLDIISLAPDQNAQESFFRPTEMDPALDGAGGVPVRTAADLVQLWEAAQGGNFPLLRIYSGTRDLLAWADLAQRTLRNAWAAIPLVWYSALDGRSPRTCAPAIRENQTAMRWHAARDIPVEVNEAHHWGLRDAHDAVSVAAAYLAAYNAKAMGVRHYLAQYMFNTPPQNSPAMDLARVLAQRTLIERLHDAHFTTYRQTRTGLLHLSPRLAQAKGQLAASTLVQLAVAPHLIHVVGYCEGDHAATALDVLESAEIVHGVLRTARAGLPDLTADPAIQARTARLIADAQIILNAIAYLGEDAEDPLTDPATLARAIRLGLLDAPHLAGNPEACGRLQTRLVDGGMEAWEGRRLTEEERVGGIMARVSPPVTPH